MLSFYISNHSSRSPSGHSVLISCFRIPPGKPSPEVLLLQLNGLHHHWCPPAGPSVTAETDTNDLQTTAPSYICNRGGPERGPFGFFDMSHGTREKSWRRLKIAQIGGSAKCSQFTFTICLGLPGLSWVYCLYVGTKCANLCESFSHSSPLDVSGPSLML